MRSLKVLSFVLAAQSAAAQAQTAPAASGGDAAFSLGQIVVTAPQGAPLTIGSSTLSAAAFDRVTQVSANLSRFRSVFLLEP